MDSIELDVRQNEKGQMIVVDQHGRRLSKVSSVQVKQSVDGANEITVTIFQQRNNEMVLGNQVGWSDAKS